MLKRTTLALALLLGACLAPERGNAPAAEGEAWRSPGKAGAPVELATPARYEAQAGETFEVALALVTTAAADAVSVAVNAGDGLLMATPVVRHDLGARAAGRIDLPALAVTAQRDGRTAVNVSVSMETAGRLRMRHFSIPVQVGEASATTQKRTDVDIDANGERVRVMRGVETP